MSMVTNMVMNMAMKTKDGRQVRESARDISNLGEYSEKRASKSKSKGAQKSEKESGEEGRRVPIRRGGNIA